MIYKQLNYIRFAAAEAVLMPLSILGSAVGSGLFQSSNTIKQTDSALRATRETNAANLKLAQENREWQERMINEQNAYNSPEAQRQRLESAGFNPLFQGDNISAGLQTIAAHQEPTHLENPASSIMASIPAFNEAINSIFQGPVQAAQVRLMDAQAKSAKADAVQKQTLTQKLSSWYDSQTSVNNANVQFIGERVKETQKNLDLLSAKADEVSANTSLLQQKLFTEAEQTVYTKALSDLTSEQRSRLDRELQWLDKEKQAEISEILARRGVALAQREHIIHGVKLLEEQIRGQIVQNGLEGLKLDIQSATKDAQISIGLLEGQNASIQLTSPDTTDKLHSLNETLQIWKTYCEFVPTDMIGKALGGTGSTVLKMLKK